MFGGRYMKENIPVLLLKKLTILPSQEGKLARIGNVPLGIVSVFLSSIKASNDCS